MASAVCIKTHHLAPIWLGRRGEGRGSLPSPVSIVRGKCLIIPSRLAAIHRHPSCHHPSLWPISDGETKGLVAWGCVQTNMLEVGLGMDSLLCTHHFVWQQTAKVPAGHLGAEASRRQWRAIQRISISWQPTPATPTLPPGVSRLHFRSWRLVITLEGGRT